MIRPTLIMWLLVVSSGCFVTPMPTQQGRPIDASFVESIKKGSTTLEAVRARLGSPASVTKTSGLEIWTYAHWRGKPALFGSGYERQKTETLTIQFKDGKVFDFSYTAAGR